MARFKPVPDPPASVARVVEVRDAVPLVPESEDDCCARLMTRCGFESRDVARTWLTFLRALGLAVETPEGFRRVREDPTVESLREAIEERVFAAREVVAVLESADEPLDADDVFSRVRDEVPTWERHKHPARWEETWRERVANILGWLALVGRLEETDEGYRPA